MINKTKLFANDAKQVMGEQAEAALYAVEHMSHSVGAGPDVRSLAEAVALGTLAVDRVKSRQ